MNFSKQIFVQTNIYEHYEKQNIIKGELRRNNLKADQAQNGE